MKRNPKICYYTYYFYYHHQHHPHHHYIDEHILSKTVQMKSKRRMTDRFEVCCQWADILNVQIRHTIFTFTAHN